MGRLFLCLCWVSRTQGGTAPSYAPDEETLARWRGAGLLDAANAAVRGPAAAQARKELGLVESLTWEQYLNPTCHTVGHEIGFRLFEEMGSLNETLEACEYRCTGGCLHGALNGYIVQSTPASGGDGAWAALRAAWVTLASNERIGRVTTVGETAHSFGHALIHAGLTTKEALDFCTTKSNLRFARGGPLARHKLPPHLDSSSRDESHVVATEGQLDATLAHYCAGGVLMQTQVAIKPKSLADRVKLCSKMPALGAAACFYYALRRAWRACACCAVDEDLNCPSVACGEKDHVCDATEVRAGAEVFEQTARALSDLCDAQTPEGRLRRACYYGAASSATFHSSARTHGGNATVALCSARRPHDDPLLKTACIDGLVFRASKYFPDEVPTLCGRFQDARDVRTCLHSANAGMYSLDKEDIILTLVTPQPGEHEGPDLRDASSSAFSNAPAMTSRTHHHHRMAGNTEKTTNFRL